MSKDNSNLIVRNKTATRNYKLGESFQAGIVLEGWEVKSLREKKVDVKNSYVTFKKNETRDERDDMINSKSYKLGYLLYELSLFIFIGYVCSKFQNKELLNLTGNHELYNSFQLTDGGIVFLILVLLAFISVIKSLYQFYLYRTV